MSLGSGPDKALLPQGMLPLDHLWLVPLYASGQSMNQRAREICVIFKTHKALSNHKSSLRPCHWYCFILGGGGCCWKRLSSKLNFKPYIFLIYWHLDEKNLYCLDTRYVISFLMSSLKEKHVWCWHSDEECFLFGGWWTARRPREVSSRPWHTCPEGKYIHLDTSIKIRPYNECSFSLVVSFTL